MRAKAKSGRPAAESFHQQRAVIRDIDLSLPQHFEASGVLMDAVMAVAAIRLAEPRIPETFALDTAVKLSDGRATVDSIRASPERYRATHVLAHLDWRMGLANAVARDRPLDGPDERAYEQVLGMWRTKPNNSGTWHDIQIAACATYADLLVSDDANQRRRCDFLRERHLLTFRTMSLAEFVG